MATKKRKFVRRHPMPGIWGITHKGRHYELKDREILETGAASLIKVLKADPEIMSFKKFNEAYQSDEREKANEKKREKKAEAKKKKEAEEEEARDLANDPGEGQPE